MREFLEHWGIHISAGAIGGGSLFAFVFRDSISRWMSDWQADRKAEREERKASQSVPQQYAQALLHLLEKNLADNRSEVIANRECIKDLTNVLSRLSESIEHLAHVADDTHTMVKETRDNTMIIKGAVS